MRPHLTRPDHADWVGATLNIGFPRECPACSHQYIWLVHKQFCQWFLISYEPLQNAFWCFCLFTIFSAAKSTRDQPYTEISLIYVRMSSSRRVLSSRVWPTDAEEIVTVQRICFWAGALLRMCPEWLLVSRVFNATRACVRTSLWSDICNSCIACFVDSRSRAVYGLRWLAVYSLHVTLQCRYYTTVVRCSYSLCRITMLRDNRANECRKYQRLISWDL